MNLQSTINHLEACLEQEVVATGDASTWIGDLEGALQQQDSQTFEQVSRGGAALCRHANAASARRISLVAKLAQHWDVPAGTLTLGSVVRRLPDQGARMDELRKQLRQAVAEVVKRQRRLAALIGLHKRINADVMQVMLGCDTPEEVNQGGALVNAEA